MTIPFLDLFKKAKARIGKQPEAPRPVAPRPPLPEKPAAERLSKTVLPNATRTVASADPFRAAAAPTGNKIRLRETSGASVKAPVERTIAITLGDLLEHLPQALLKPAESLDLKRSISIKALEVEKGMATGQPTALLVSIYEQAPDIFQQSVPLTDVTQVPLPLQKVMEQFQAVQVRADQMQDEAVPQVETPFLQVTIEDTQKFGTTLAPLQTSAKPPVKVEAATARTIAKAEPEPVVQEKQTIKFSSRAPISLSPKLESAPPPSVPPPPADSGAAPARIPFKLPPNGAGAPASERVPASSGPPVPTPPAPPPAPPKSAAPVRIPFKMTPPNAALKPKLTLVPGVDPISSEEPVAPQSAAAPAESAKSEVIRLRLNVCFRNLPAFQLAGDLPEIADDVQVELPFSLVEPQLATGRIAIDPKVFQSAVPEQHRDSFVIDTAQTPVLLPLQEVLQHLPGSALKMRQDQEHEEAVDHFETPFSLHAKEDRQRLGASGVEPAKAPEPATAPVTELPAEFAKSEVAPAVEKPQRKVKERAKSTEGRAPASPEAKEFANTPGVAGAPPSIEAEKKQTTPAADEKGAGDQLPAGLQIPAESTAAEAKNNAKEFVARVSCLPGVAGCSIAFSDGLTMAGNLPPNLDADGLSAVAPSVLQKIEKHMIGTHLGALNSMTLTCGNSSISFFMQGTVCLTVLHTQQNLEPVTQEQLVDMTKQLAQIFAQPETN